MGGIIGPHQKIECSSRREEFTADLFDRLWDQYRQRVSYVRDYERVVTAAGARFINDHIAFRTIACQQPLAGIATLGRIFEALGYRAAGLYDFPDKHLNAIHFQHPHSEFPKLFISEFRSWELPAEPRSIIGRLTGSHRSAVSCDDLAHLATLDESPASDYNGLMETVLSQFTQLPWRLPEAKDVNRLNEISQYAAWVAVHGYAVNHFTALVNSHGVELLDGIDKTVAALRAAGVPMKSEIEGTPGSKLRQTATEAVVIDVDVLQDGNPANLAWTYAYFELAERNEVVDPQTGTSSRFEGFLGPQATHLFEMTKRKQDD